MESMSRPLSPIFDKVEKFASYGFNKSHAAAYGYLSYVTAYLKANYPLHWMAALMTSDRDDLTKVTKIIRECQAMHIAILPPDVNESASVFVPTPKGIRFAMTAVKGVGEGVVEAIVQERKANGSFENLYDFIKRIDTHKVGKKVIECLIEAGAFDFSTWTRAELIASVEPMYQVAQKEQKENERGELNFFSLIEDEDARFANPPNVAPLTKMDILRREKELLGFYLTGHPLDDVAELLQKLSCVTLEQVENLDSGAICRAGFVIESVSVRLTNRTGRKFAILTIGDSDIRFELPIWSDLFEAKGHLLIENQLIYAVLQVEKDEGGQRRLQCRWFDDLTKADETMMQECDLAYDKARMQAKMAHLRKTKPRPNKEPSKKEEAIVRTLILKLNAKEMRLSHILELKKIFKEQSGSSGIELEFWTEEKQVGKISIEPTYGVELTGGLKNLLEEHPAVIDILAKSG